MARIPFQLRILIQAYVRYLILPHECDNLMQWVHAVPCLQRFMHMRLLIVCKFMLQCVCVRVCVCVCVCVCVEETENQRELQQKRAINVMYNILASHRQLVMVNNKKKKTATVMRSHLPGLFRCFRFPTLRIYYSGYLGGGTSRVRGNTAVYINIQQNYSI